MEALKQAGKELPGARFLPLGSMVSPGVIRLKDGSGYVATWRLEGIPFATATIEDLESRKNAIVGFYKALAGGDKAIWMHRIRRRFSDHLGGAFADAFSQRLNDAYEAGLEKGMMETALYLSIVIRTTPLKRPGVLWFSTKSEFRSMVRKEERAIEEVESLALQVQAMLKRFGPTRLTVVEREGRMYCEQSEHFAYVLNGRWQPVPVRPMQVSSQITTDRMFFGDRNGFWEAQGAGGASCFGRFYDILSYPQYATQETSDGLLSGEFSYIETQSFSMHNRRNAVDALKIQKSQLIAGDEAGIGELQSLDDAVNALRDGLIEMGEYHYSLSVLGDSVEEVEKAGRKAEACMLDADFVLVPQTECPEAAWAAQIPGAWKYRPRLASIPSTNFACMAPLHNHPRGKRTGNPWGDAVSLLATPSGQPFYFSFHASTDDRDNTDDKLPGNTLVIGQTGVGKTTAVLFLLAQLRRRLHDGRSVRAAFFDKDRGAEIAIRAMGGRYIAFERGRRTGINPFAWNDTPEVRALCEQIVAQCVGGIQSARERDDVAQAVKTVFSLPKHIRRLAAVRQSLPPTGDNSLYMRLERWVDTGPLAWVLDNAEDELNLKDGTLFGFDYTTFLDDPEICTPIMMALLFATQSLIDGRPFAFFMDEFWKPLRNQIFSDFAKNKLKTIRKENGLGVFITQSPSDTLEHEIGKTIVEQCVTQVFLPNPRADREDYVGGFKLTEREFSTLRRFTEDSRLMLVKQGLSSAVVRLDLGAFPDELIALSGSVDNAYLLDEIRARVGDRYEDWWPELVQAVRRRRLVARKDSVRGGA